MKIHIWNAFASNNSGSYTIVGSFPSPERAAQVAAELAEVVTAHAAWMKTEGDKQQAWTPEGISPLQEFIQRQGLTWEPQLGATDDWPRYGDKDAPDVWALGHQVLVHHDYTVTLPRTFGEFFYKRGGRVDTELDHAHHPLVALFELWLPHGHRSQDEAAALLASLVEELNADEGPLVKHVQPGTSAAWRAGEHFIAPSLTVGAVFSDLVAGFTEVERIAQRHGMRASVKVLEALTLKDPVGFLRPSRPPLKRELFDVHLTDVGPDEKQTREALKSLGRASGEELRLLLGAVPTAVMRELPRERAEEAAELLRRAGATVELRPAAP